MEVVYSWAKGSKFYQIMEMTQVFEGSMISAIWRLEEALQQLILAPKSDWGNQIGSKLEEAVSKIKRNRRKSVLIFALYTITDTEIHCLLF